MMKRTNFIALMVLLLAVCVPLLLTAVRESITGFVGEHIIRKAYRSDFWDTELLRFGITGIIFVILSLFCRFNWQKLTKINLSDKTYWVINTGLIAVFAVAAGCMCFNRALWFDEVYSLGMIRRSWSEFFALSLQDQHPPLYYILLKATVAMTGNCIFSMKLLSVVPSVLTLITVSVFLKKRFSSYTAMLFTLCFLTSDSILNYSLELRMYSWAFFFITIQAIAAFIYYGNGNSKWLIFFAVASLGAAYTNLYAAFAAGIVYAIFLFYIFLNRRKQAVSVILTGILCVIGFSSQIYFVIHQLESTVDSYWIENSTNLRAMADYISIAFSDGNYLVAFIWFLIFCGLTLYFIKVKDKTANDLFAFSALAAVLLFWGSNMLIAVLIKPLFVGRYLLPVLPLLWLFMSIEAGRHIKKAGAMMLICTLATMSVMQLATRTVREVDESENFNSFTECLAGNITPDDVFLFTDWSLNLDQMSCIVSWIYPAKTHVFPTIGKHNERFKETLFNNQLISYNQYFNDKNLTSRPLWIFVSDPKTLLELSDLGISADKIRYCGEYEWFIYNFKLYKILMHNGVFTTAPE
jgi:uncharacterized membrane protein